MEVHLPYLHDTISRSLLGGGASGQSSIHPTEVKGDHDDDGEPQQEDVPCLPRLVDVCVCMCDGKELAQKVCEWEDDVIETHLVVSWVLLLE